MEVLRWKKISLTPIRKQEKPIEGTSVRRVHIVLLFGHYVFPVNYVCQKM